MKLRIISLLTVLTLLLSLFPVIPAYAQITENEFISIDPTTGKIGETIDVTGDGFAASEKVYLYFSPEELSVGDYVDDADIFHLVKTKTTDADGYLETSFKVPSRLTTGPTDENVHGGTYWVYATYDTEGEIVAYEEFRVLFISISPTEGIPGTSLSITGQGFEEGDDITIEWDGDEVAIASGDRDFQDEGAFTCTITIPASPAGSYDILVSDDSGNEAEVTFTVRSGMTITPTSGSAPDRITIKGSGFAGGSNVSITFRGTEVVSQRSGTNGSFEVSFTVPIMVAGGYDVKATDGSGNSATGSFTIITRVTLSPATGNVGNQVTVNGAGFRANAPVTITYAPDNTTVANATTDANGVFSATFNAPRSVHGGHVVTATDGTATVTATFTMESTPPPIPTPSLPLMGTKAKSQAVFQWGAVTDPSLPVTYTLQISTTSAFSTILLEKKNIATNTYTLTKEEKLKSTKKEAPYYWRVRATDGASNDSGLSTPGTFYVGFVFPELPTAVIVILIVIGAILLFLIGLWLGRRALM